MTVEEYEAEALQDLQIDVTRLEDCARVLGLRKAKWARHLYDEECILAEVEERLNELYRDKFHFYLYEFEQKIEKKSVDVYVKGDPTYKEAEKMYKKQKAKTRLVEQVIAAMDKQSFTMNIILKHMAWESGASAT